MNGWTALHWAAKRGHGDIVKTLLESGADPSVKSTDGAEPLDVASQSSVRILLGGEANGDAKPKESLPIMPNYLTHPPFPYLAGSSSYRPSEPAAMVSAGQRAPPPPQALPSADTPPRSNGPVPEENELVLKVRVANSMEQDFIEIEIDLSRLTFEYVLSAMCRELNVNPAIVHKMRKLPNTIVRKDKDVRRFVDFQELELVLTNRASSEASRNYGPSVSPRHVDVVY